MQSEKRELLINIMKMIKTIFKSEEQLKVLGRWGLHNVNQQNIKIDLTNEDHCGVCDKMRYEYIEKEKKHKNID
jgi:hypothetical protein